jgi:hypothetical protein
MRKSLTTLMLLAALGSGPAAAQSLACIDQMGNQNTVSLTQQGHGNHFENYQHGNGTILTQSGSKNSALIYQICNQNTATGIQTGNMEAIIEQRGHGHKAEVSSNEVLSRGSRPVTVTQYGVGAKVEIRTVRYPRPGTDLAMGPCAHERSLANSNPGAPCTGAFSSSHPSVLIGECLTLKLSC